MSEIELPLSAVKFDLVHKGLGDVPFAHDADGTPFYHYKFELVGTVLPEAHTFCRDRFQEPYYFEERSTHHDKWDISEKIVKLGGLPHIEAAAVKSPTQTRWFLVGHQDDLALFKMSF
jgi:hypothetical protein